MRLEYAGYFSASEIFTQRRYTGLYLLRVVGIIINICNSRTIYPDVESPPYTPEKGYLLSYLILSNTAIQGNSNCSRLVLNVYEECASLPDLAAEFIICCNHCFMITIYIKVIRINGGDHGHKRTQPVE